MKFSIRTFLILVSCLIVSSEAFCYVTEIPPVIDAWAEDFDKKSETYFSESTCKEFKKVEIAGRSMTPTEQAEYQKISDMYQIPYDSVYPTIGSLDLFVDVELKYYNPKFPESIKREDLEKVLLEGAITIYADTKNLKGIKISKKWRPRTRVEEITEERDLMRDRKHLQKVLAFYDKRNGKGTVVKFFKEKCPKVWAFIQSDKTQYFSKKTAFEVEFDKTWNSRDSDMNILNESAKAIRRQELKECYKYSTGSRCFNLCVEQRDHMDDKNLKYYLTLKNCY